VFYYIDKIRALLLQHRLYNADICLLMAVTAETCCKDVWCK